MRYLQVQCIRLLKPKNFEYFSILKFRTMNKLILFIICALFLSLSSCDKEDIPPVKPKSELLTQSTWKFKAATANGADVSNQNPPFAPCRKDNIITFVINGSGTVSEGATSCSPAENANFTWNFTSNESMIHFFNCIVS